MKLFKISETWHIVDINCTIIVIHVNNFTVYYRTPQRVPVASLPYLNTFFQY